MTMGREALERNADAHIYYTAFWFVTWYDCTTLKMPATQGAADAMSQRRSRSGGMMRPMYAAAATASMMMPCRRRFNFPALSILPELSTGDAIPFCGRLTARWSARVGAFFEG